MTADDIQDEAERVAKRLLEGDCRHRVGMVQAWGDCEECIAAEVAAALRRQREEACPNSDDHHEHSVMWEALERLGASFDMGLSDHGASGIVKRALGEYQRGREEGAREERDACAKLAHEWGLEEKP